MKTMLTKVVSGVAMALAAAAFAPGASAQDTQAAYPVRLTLRPQTIPQRTVRIDAGFGANRIEACVTILGGRSCGGATSTVLSVGGAYGILDDLEVGATVLPLQLTDDFAYLNPSVYGRYRFLRNDQMQLAADLTLTFPARSGSSFGMSVGVPAWFYINEAFQIQTGLYYQATFSDPVSHGLWVPAVFNINVMDNLHVGIRTGLSLPFRDTGDTLSVPLGVEVGYAVAQANNRPIVDIVPYFHFPLFLVPGSSGDVVQTGLWTTGVNARVYLFL